MAKIRVLGSEIAVRSVQDADYISLTDMARYKETGRTDYVIQNWLRNRNTIEFLGLWEQLNNADFEPIEFDGFRSQAERLRKLNQIAIQQMGILTGDANIRQLEAGDE